MSAAAKNSAAYWRIAGMSYLKYANACGEVVRQSLKEPFLTQVRTIDRRVRAEQRLTTRFTRDSTGQGARNGVLQDDKVRRRQGGTGGCVNERRRGEEA
jgi:F-type H+-transporting ATPase subunit epsilon